MEHTSIQVARFVLGGSWIYHGLFPKLLTVAPIEKAMTATIGLSEQYSLFLTRSVGVAEVIFGLLIIVYYRHASLLLVNIVLLVLLVLFVAIQMPALLIEAFNPVTTNLALIGLSYVLIRASDA